MTSIPERHYLTPLFEPAAVAVIGASDRRRSAGAVLVGNLLSAGYRGALFGVNPHHRKVRGVPCYPSIGQVPRRVDLALVTTPAVSVPDVIEQCGRAGVRAAVVITAGFSEAGPAGARLERSLLESARRHRLRVVGPNCLGIMRPALGLDATFARGGAPVGSLGLISQSGSVCTAMVDWARSRRVGFSCVATLGNSIDIEFGEVIDYLVNDPKTEHILLFIERVRDARRFVSSLRAAARVKPVILMKVGRQPGGARVPVAHAGALAGSDAVFDAVVRRAGVVRVRTIGQLFAAAQALAARIRPQGERLAVVTNGGGAGAMAADCAADLGVPLASLGAATVGKLRAAMPAEWSPANPVDLIGDADAARYRAAVSACLEDPDVDGVLAILTPQAMTVPEEAAVAVIEEARRHTKPVLACWMGEEQVAAARRRFAEAGIPVHRAPDTAVETFAHVSAFFRNQRALLQTPGPVPQQAAPDLAAARRIVETALAQERMVLDETESRALLAAFGIPVARAGSGGTPGAGATGVAIEPMIRRTAARELTVGVLRDPVFGPAITFGAGGAAVEVLRDRTVALPPLNAILAADMIRGAGIGRLLGAWHGLPAVDTQALEEVLLRVSGMACELPELEQLDINPLIADEIGVAAARARVVLRRDPRPGGRYAHMAIHPYPAPLVSVWQPAHGPVVTLRPIRPEDAAIEQEFVRGLSPGSRYFRFMDTLRELTPAMLLRFTQIDYDREMAFIATIERDAREVEIGVCRYVTGPDGETCEFAIVIADDWQRRGLGRRLLTLLIDVARARGLKLMVGHVLTANRAMLGLCEDMGFTVAASADDPGVRRVELVLAEP